MHKEHVSPKPLTWKTRAEFCEFVQSVGLNAQTFKGQQVWKGQSLQGSVLLPERRQAKNLEADSMEIVI